MRSVFTRLLLREVLVSKCRTQAPWEFLLSASRNTLQSYELSRLAHAANLKKEITALLDQWLEETTAANLARWLIEQRHRTVTVAEDTQSADLAGSNGENGSDNFLGEHFAPGANSGHHG